MIIKKRSAGILLHITSLPSRFGIGDLGPEAYKFADQLQEAGQRYWQILPLNPTEIGSGNSPYSSHSAFAGNPLLVSPELLVEEGLLHKQDLKHEEEFDDARVDFAKVSKYKIALLQKAYQYFSDELPDGLWKDFTEFQKEQKLWLQDFANFVAFKKNFEHKSWVEWPKEIKRREKQAVKELAEELSEQVEFEMFMQFIFYRQWEKLKSYCNSKDITFFGDMPFYVSHDSADVWSHPHLFKLDDEGMPTSVSGVPPDFFSETGQLWGTPVYDWKAMAKQEYDWWIDRIDHNLRLFGILRLDHFRAFSAYWEVPAKDETAENGKWKESPGKEILGLVQQKYPEMPIVAEDLGDIDQPVRDLIHDFDLPGMIVLLFAFVGDEHAFESSFMPHNHTRNSIVYTGTHDNSTVRAWFEKAPAKDKKLFSRYSYHDLTDENAAKVMVWLAYMSVSQLAVVPVQDVLGLGKEGIMNKPSTGSGNWEWRLQPKQFSKEHIKELQQLANLYGR
ncbi:4-alpha-glucanotransferase [Pontibacter akesuensis]|uniref:4-alpha-glucanotransferase n=1 Tax=Pontibacter akesuensis TaxID=388950 RepID=A0A1I7KF27_9BACT|nr:4-alpha-glucanotransferase [Pontibacter akesuensis]GHA79702.1 4-alpha-glucanotransferase [Pontibacter akesuensis]SFU96000.1 4-alpha-glucanotransferase [Pontibacter akesuensis]